MMTPEEIAESRRICGAASQDWIYWDNRGKPIMNLPWPLGYSGPSISVGVLEGIRNQGVWIDGLNGIHRPEDCVFAVHARTALPKALDEIERLRSIIDKMITQLWESARDTFVDLSKDEFDSLCKTKAFAEGPLRTDLSKFAKEFGPYAPERWAFGRLRDGRLVCAKIQPLE